MAGNVIQLIKRHKCPQKPECFLVVFVEVSESASQGNTIELYYKSQDFLVVFVEVSESASQGNTIELCYKSQDLSCCICRGK